MSTPVVICDDSSFARKQIARALPGGWDVSLSFASNGREGIEAVRNGKGDVLFLDLTMPDMDGFEVLEFIRSSDLPTLPIVVSGDIQPESQRRVMQLGAVAFIKKPVDAAELVEVLKGYGVLELLHAEPTTALEEVDFYDWSQEIANVAMGRAASLLAGVVHEGVELSIPRVNLLEPAEFAMLMGSVGHSGVSVVSQGFIGAGLSGETLLFFEDSSVPALGRLMGYGSTGSDSMEMELLMEVGNVLVGAFLKGIAEQLDIKFSQGHPQLYLHRRADELLQGSGLRRTLAIELSYTIGHERIHCDQLLLFTEDSLDALQQRMEMARV
jgi:chemotaxis protein CheY-P-specific phosphatase CheC